MKHANPYLEYYRRQAGGRYDVFSGPLIQRGYGFGSVFKSIFRFIKPVFRAFAPVAKQAGPAIGREILSAGTGLLGDLAEGRDFKTSAAERLKEAGTKLTDKAVEKIGQLGSGRRIKRKRIAKPRQSSKRRTRTRLDIFD